MANLRPSVCHIFSLTLATCMFLSTWSHAENLTDHNNPQTDSSLQGSLPVHAQAAKIQADPAQQQKTPDKANDSNADNADSSLIEKNKLTASHQLKLNSNNNTATDEEESDVNADQEAIHEEGDSSASTNAANVIKAVQALLRKEQTLIAQIEKTRQSRDAASEAIINSIERRNEAYDAREHASSLRQQTEKELWKVRQESSTATNVLHALRKQLEKKKEDAQELLLQKFSIQRQKVRIADAFRSRGLENWVENSLKHSSAGPFVTDALVQGTASVVEPMLEGLEKLGNVNDQLTKQMSKKLRSHVPMVEKPFYSGFVTYAVLLFPSVLVISVVMKVKRGFAKLSIGHAVILGNFYFGLLSGGCFVATLLGSVDVLLTFRHHNVRLFDFVMFLHGLLFVAHSGLHSLLSYRLRDRTSGRQTVLILGIGGHFFIHSYRHALRNEDSNVDKSAYLAYTCMFFYVLYDLTFKQLGISKKSKSMTLNNTSITASKVVPAAHKDGSTAEAVAVSGSTLRRFPTTRQSFIGKDVHQLTTRAHFKRSQSLREVGRDGPSGPRTNSAVNVNVCVSSAQLQMGDAAAARNL